MGRRSRGRLRFIGGFLLYFAALWAFWNTPVVYPVQVFVVFLHEISHGVAAIATGGAIRAITLSPALGGVCHCPGGNAFVTLSAGYLGSLLWGGLVFETGRKAGAKAPAISGGIGAAVVVLTLLFVRGIFGLLFGISFGLFLLVMARRLPVGWNRTLLVVLGLTSCLYAVLDIKSDVLDRPHLPSDAFMLAELTGIPTVVWGATWIGVALGVSAWLLRRAFRDA